MARVPEARAARGAAAGGRNGERVPSIDLLQFDTDHFGFPCYRLVLGEDDEVGVIANTVEPVVICGEGAHVVCRLPAERHGQMAALRRLGFWVVAGTLEVMCPVRPAPRLLDGKNLTRPATISDVPRLRDISAQSFVDTRFHRDPAMAAKAADFHALWAENSVNGYADMVLVRECDGDIAGFVTAHHEGESDWRLGLIAVDLNSPHRPGTAAILLNEVEDTIINASGGEGWGIFWGAAPRVNLRAATEAHSTRALNFYLGSRGFRLEASYYTMHLYRAWG